MSSFISFMTVSLSTRTLPPEQWRAGGGGWGFKPPPPPEIPKALQNRTKLNPIWKLLKIAEYKTPTHQDVREKKAVKF